MTPRMSAHARQRCAEMGITTKRAKRIVRERVTSYHTQSHRNDGVVCMSDDADLAVVWDPIRNVVLTVLPRTSDQYSRSQYRDTCRVPSG
jgi:hypothetical protein